MKRNIRNVLSVAAVVLIFALLLGFLTRLLQPKYMDTLVEGSMLSQYYDEYDEAGGHDVIFIGDCEVYANFTPLEMYRHAGITAYVRGSSQQLIWQSYYVLAETLKYETPKAVVLNVNSMRHGEPGEEPAKEEFNRLTIDYMRWSPEKVGMIQASMLEGEDFLSYVFPILRYHSRFDQLTQEDFTYLFTRKDTTFNGHLVNQAVNPVGSLPAKRPLRESQFADVAYSWLDKITALCKEKGVELILVKAPSVYPYWYDEYDAQMEAYAAENGLTFYNFLDYTDQIGIDYQTDTYDAGLHLNLNGATKLSKFFADILVQNHGIPDHRGEPEVDALYQKKLEAYDAVIQNG